MDLRALCKRKRQEGGETEEMTTPEATLKLMNEGFWGAKAMERRVIKCCADHPACPFAEQCYQDYVKFVDTTEPPDKKEWPSYKQSVAGRLRNYHLLRQLGFSGKEAARQMTNKQTRLALETVGQ
jgi:hypothetical protein